MPSSPACLAAALVACAWVPFTAAPVVAQAGSAPGEAIVLRYTPVEPGEVVLTHIQNRGARRGHAVGIDTLSPQFADEIYYGLRFAEYDSADVRRVKFTVAADETRSGIFGDEIKEWSPAGRAYDVTVQGDSVSVVPRKPTAPDATERVRQWWTGTATHDAYGEYLNGRRFVAGSPVELPDSLLRFLGAGRATLTFTGVETRWQRRIARFALAATSVDSRGYRVDGAGDLLVDSASGRPLQLGWTGRGWNGDTTMNDGMRIGLAGVASSLRIWAYRSIPLLGHQIELVAQSAPKGMVRSMAVSPDGRTLAMLTTGQQLAYWDTRLRRTTSVNAQDAREVAYGDTILFVLQDLGFMQGWRASGARGIRFGRSDGTMPLDGGDPVGFAMAGMYPVVAYDDGSIDVRNLGYNRRVGRHQVSDAGLVAIAATPDGTRFVTIDSLGGIALHTIEIGTAGCSGDWRTSWCERATLNAVTPLVRERTPLGAVSGVALHPGGELVAVATPAGDVHLWQHGASLRALEGAGRRVRFSRDGSSVFTERGRFAVDGRDSLVVSGSETDPPRQLEHIQIAVSPDEQLLFRSRSPRGASDDAGSAVIEVIDLASGAVVEEIRSRTSAVMTARVDTLTSGLGAVVDHPAHVAAWDFSQLRVAPLELPSQRIDALQTTTRLLSPAARAVSVASAMREAAGVAGSEAPYSTAVSHDAGFLAVGRLGRIELDDAVKGERHANFRTGAFAPVVALRFHPRNADRLFTLSGDGTLQLWDVPAGETLFSTTVPIARPSAGRFVPPLAMAVSPDGRRIAITRGRSTRGVWNPQIPVVLLVDGATGTVEQELVPRWGTVAAAAFSEDGELLAIGDDDGRVRLYDVRSGTIALEFRAHESAITTVGFLPDSPRFFTASLDGTLKIWRSDDPGAVVQPTSAILRLALGVIDRPTHHVATLVAVDSTEHVVMTGDGYYTASRGALRGFALVNGGEAFDFERYDLWLNRPDIVARRLGVADAERVALLEAVAARRVASIGSSVSLMEATTTPPVVAITGNSPRFTADTAATLRIEATPGAAPVARLDIRVNSVPVHGVGGRRIAGAPWSGTVSLPLSRGVNRIQVSVTDSRGVESPRQTVVITRTAPPHRPDMYVLAVGVSDYADDRLDLAYAAKDAGDIAATFASDTTRFANVHVHRILDGQATRGSILAARSFLERAGVDDEVVVFFAGHGFLDRRLDYYFGTADVDPASPERRGIAYAELVGLVDGITSRKRLLLLDTCHAGEVDTEAPPAIAAAFPLDTAAKRVSEFRGLGLQPLAAERGPGTFEVMRELFADLRAQSGATVLSAAGGAEYAMEAAKWSNGAFTYSLLEGLQDRLADADADGRITVVELEQYVSQRVVELTSGGQRPTARQRNLDMNFVVR